MRDQRKDRRERLRGKTERERERRKEVNSIEFSTHFNIRHIYTGIRFTKVINRGPLSLSILSCLSVSLSVLPLFLLLLNLLSETLFLPLSFS